MNLNFIKVFQKIQLFFITLFINYLNIFEQVCFDNLQYCSKLTILKMLLTSVIFIFNNVFNWA